MAAGKKRVDHVAWQIEVATNEEWEDLTKLQGLVVVDVYSEWCGPCTAMASHLKEIKLQLGDDLLHCALAKADGITELAKFRGRSEPTWLFLAGGQPVAMIRGANAPLIRKTLLTELEIEKEVLEGARQRVSLSWDSFDIPSNNAESDKPNSEVAELPTAPDNWLELDALSLQGSYRLVTEKLFQALTERHLDISAKSAVRLNQKDSLILWFPSSVEDESLAEWFDITMKALIEEVEPKVLIEEVEDEQPPVETTEEKEESTEKAEETDENKTDEAEPEVPEYQAIEFRLITEQEEKETLIKQIQQAEEANKEEERQKTEAENQNVEEETAAEEHQVEEKQEETVENESAIVENPVEDVPESTEST